jgi:PAS domain-containing protein
MSQPENEIKLSQQFAEHLAMPIFIVNPAGDLVYYNKPAELILGTRFSETGIMPASEWSTKFHPVDQNGDSIPPDDLPLVFAIKERQPAHKIFWIIDLDGNLRQLEVTALPIIGQGDRFVGGMAIFWEKFRG